MRKVSALLLALSLLLTSFAAPTRAAYYSDLPETHWAYADMDRASELGIIRGVGENRMDPQGTLTWAQFLTMLCRAFAGGAYRFLTDSGLSWDAAAYETALQHGFLLYPDFLPVDGNSLSSPISRQETAVLLSRVLPDGVTPQSGFREDAPLSGASALTDYYEMDYGYRDAVDRLFDLGIVKGRDDGAFGPDDTLRRCDGTVLVMRTLQELDEFHDGETIRLEITMTDEDGAVIDVFTTQGAVGCSLYLIAEQVLPYGYRVDYEANARTVSTAQNAYTVVLARMTQEELAEIETLRTSPVDPFLLEFDDMYANTRYGYDDPFAGDQPAYDYDDPSPDDQPAYDYEDPFADDQSARDDVFAQNPLLRERGENTNKHLLLFGDPDKRQFVDREEAEANMTTVQVPVWRLDGDRKVFGTASIKIHAALAEDVVRIFTEIYNDPEQFPIEDVGGYSWRGGSSYSEHSNGTAIDINAAHNPQMRGGSATNGGEWRPGEDPLSIPENGSVVRIFAEHGWSWGGNAWQSSTDYMHFSYMGL